MGYEVEFRTLVFKFGEIFCATLSRLCLPCRAIDIDSADSGAAELGPANDSDGQNNNFLFFLWVE